MINSVVLSVLGVSINFICESKSILEKIITIFPQTENDSKTSSISIHLCQSDAEEIKLMRPPEFQISDTSLKGRSGASSFIADRNTMSGEAYLCKAMLEDEYLFRHQILNSMVFYLLSYKLFTPIHCVCFQIDQTTFVCIGRSGSGKSTIALAAMQRGHRVLAEDVCFIGENPNFSLNTDCREIHVFPESFKLVSNVSDVSITQAHNGKLKCRVPIPNAEPVRANENIKILFLDPNHLQLRSTISDFTYQPFYDELYKPKEEGFSLVSRSRKKSVDWLKKQPTYTIRTGNNLENFFEVVQQLM